MRPTPDPVQPGQESVWSYPRPPRLERANAHLKVVLGGVTIAETNDAFRVLETSHPPNYYFPPERRARRRRRRDEGRDVLRVQGRARPIGRSPAASASRPKPRGGTSSPSPSFAPIARSHRVLRGPHGRVLRRRRARGAAARRVLRWVDHLASGGTVQGHPRLPGLVRRDDGHRRRSPGERRFHTEIDWLDSWHSFSFCEPLRPEEHAPRAAARAQRRRRRAPGAGFGMHPHRDMEIVTWVLDGALEHRDSEGNHGVITPRPRAAHERGHAASATPRQNASRDEPVHLLQMWVLARHAGHRTRVRAASTSPTRSQDDELFPLASGREDDAAITIHQRDATLWVGAPRAGATRRRSRTRRSCTCSSRAEPPKLDGVGRARHRRRRPPHRRRRARRSPPGPDGAEVTDVGDLRRLGHLTKSRQAAVGEDLAAGLTRRAVHDLVRLVRDPLQVVAAHRDTATPACRAR